MKLFDIDYFKPFLFLLLSIIFSLNVNSQTISIPDSEFEQYLINDGIDSDGTLNGLIAENDALNVPEFNMDGYNISNFEGLQFFTDLTKFVMRNNFGPINNINFNGNLLLEDLRIYDAPSLSNVDVNQNTLLSFLVIKTYGNLFTAINLANNSNLDILVLANNNLSTLNLDNNSNITYLDLGFTPLATIDLDNLSQLQNLSIYQSSIESIDLSQNPMLNYFQGGDSQLSFVNLQNGENNILNTVIVTGNPNLSCILVDDVAYAENNTGWYKDTTATYTEETISIDVPAQDVFVQDDGSGNSQQVGQWFDTNGGATVNACGTFFWTFDYTLTFENHSNGMDIFYTTTFTVTDEFGNTDTTSASFVIENIKHFTDFTYGTGETICDDQWDLNSVITDIELEATLTSSDIISYTFSRVPNSEPNEGPSGTSFSATTVEFPDTGAGSYSYLFSVEVNKSVPVYRPELDDFDSTVITDEANITLNDKTVAFETEELGDITVCPGEISSLQDLTDRLVIYPDPDVYQPQEPIDLNQYWSQSDYTGPGQYTFDPTDAFPNCPSNAIIVTVFEEEELLAGENVLDAVDDSSYICGDTVSFDLNFYLDASADTGGSWFDVNGTEISNTIVEFPDTGAGQFTKAFTYRQENSDCGFFSEADYNITYDVAGLSTGTSTTLEICSGSVLTEQELLDALSADSGGFWSPSLDSLDVQPGIYNYSHGDCGTEGDSSIEVIANDCTVTLDAKIYLQGASISPNNGEENLMRDDLRLSGFIPTTSPYSDGLTCDISVFNSGGSSGTGAPNNDIVDWVHVELRDKTDASSVLYQRSALLQRDGTIVAEDGLSDITILAVFDDYFLSITHRNHIGIISNSVLTFHEATTTIDFTSGNVTLGSNSQVLLDTGVKALWAGDVNGDGMIRYLGPNNDTNFLKNSVLVEPNNTTNSNFYPFNAYSNSDIDMNGQIRYLGPSNDTIILKSIILIHPDNQNFSNFFPFSTQIPN